MKKIAIFATLISALMLGSVNPAIAASATGGMAFNGALSYAPPPASCSVGSQYVDASFQTPYDSYTLQYTKALNLSVNCTNGIAYSVKPPAAANKLPLGDTFLNVGFTKAGKNIYTYPVTGTGSGAPQAIALNANFSRWDSSPFDEDAVGTVSGAVTFEVTY
jgi:type 1 fimbria pilin